MWFTCYVPLIQHTVYWTSQTLPKATNLSAQSCSPNTQYGPVMMPRTELISQQNWPIEKCFLIQLYQKIIKGDRFLNTWVHLPAVSFPSILLNWTCKVLNTLQKALAKRVGVYQLVCEANKRHVRSSSLDFEIWGLILNTYIFFFFFLK